MFLTTALTITLAEESKFTVDVSAMSAPAQEAWAKLFVRGDAPSYRGNPNIGLDSLPDNKGKIAGHFQKNAVFRITGDEPVEFWMGGEKIFSTALEKKENYIIVGYFTIPEEEECTIVNSDKAFETGIYPVIDIRESRYFFDEYRYWASQLLLPVEENEEKAYLGIDVVFQGRNKVSYYGTITLDENRQLIMIPSE